MKTLFLSLVILLLVFIFSCNKKVEYPNEPVLTFNSFSFTADTDKITKIITNNVDVLIDFTDGDGDLGIPDGQKSTPENANLFYSTYYKLKGEWKKIVPVAPFPDPSTAWIPTLNKTGKSKPLKGKINVTLTDAFNSNSEKDTMRLEIYVKDNAGNKSNVITTTETRGLIK